ncbi:SAP domain protein [Haemophilus pittmaniae HK 85]|uniref:SAP domain protein n=1 Tax=Haemophilus pittmaniae HK 85 TaxID=1035188 RepID=F9Q9N7_9PAST|nr:HI1506-related protein [Haemophilus pittmaniae]EGV05661.1 SAP domain protein [Haemophilus pittmaniae HK 85]SNV66875.1 Mu-like prophage FluMu protein gp35 [Haemophilus pittmaniae]
MDKTSCVVVQNRLKDGYRRAGLSLHKGDNVFENLSATQIAALKGDARLVVKEITANDAEKSGEGLSEDNANRDEEKSIREDPLPTDLNTLTVEQLKNALRERGRTFDGNAKKADLIALLNGAE